MGNDGNGLVEALLGLPGFRVLAVAEGPSELVVTVETVFDRVGCTSCGVRAKAQDRMAVAVRDLACFGRPVRLVWIKRRWRCVDVDCSAKTWTEASEHVGAQVVLTRRGGAEACRQVGELARPVATVAAELGVCWWTVMNAVVEHGTPLVDDPERIGVLRHLGVDETSFLAANWKHCTIYATGLVDLERGALTITRAISEGVDGPVEHPRPKTRGSVRRLALDEATVAILAAHRCRHTQAATACGASLPGNAFVFSHEPDGSVPWKPGYVSLKFRRLRHSVGLDQVRLHDLRHFVATTLLGAGFDLQTVAGRLGHAGGGRTTLAVYSHFQQAADRNAADLLGKLLSPKG